MPIVGGPGGYKVCHLGNLRVWPERGLIHVEDTRDGSYKCLSIEEAMHRTHALIEMLRNQRQELHESGAMHREKWDQLAVQVGELLAVIREAIRQGDPFDPNARKWVVQGAPRLFTVPAGVAEVKS